MTDNGAIVLQGLRKSYPGRKHPAIDGISLSVGAGDFFGILGPNGAGKTTLISMLCGVLGADSGRASVLGHDALREPSSIKAQVGLVPQEVALYPSLSARENLGLFGRLYGLRGRRLKRRVEECVQIAGLADRADDRVDTYSGGMKRLTNLVVGIVHEPSILILDEPTAGIDVETRLRVYDTLTAMHRNGVCMVYTSHYLEEVERLCSRVAILDRGRILADGTAAELLRAEKHANLEGLFLALTRREDGAADDG